MNLSNLIRILNYFVAFLSLGYAVYEFIDFRNRESNTMWWVALIKIGVPLTVSIVSILILILNHNHENQTAIENQEKEARLNATINQLETQVLDEQQTIRSLTAIANIHFSGDWDPADLPFSDQLYIAAPEHMIFVQAFGTPPVRMELYGNKMYRFAETPGGHRVFAVAAAIKPGSWPLGESIKSLEEIKSAIITMPIIAPAKLKTPKLRIHSALVQFTVNEKYAKKFLWEESADQTRDHNFLPPNQNIENRLVHVPIAEENGLKNWEASP